MRIKYIRLLNVLLLCSIVLLLMSLIIEVLNTACVKAYIPVHSGVAQSKGISNYNNNSIITAYFFMSLSFLCFCIYFFSQLFLISNVPSAKLYRHLTGIAFFYTLNLGIYIILFSFATLHNISISAEDIFIFLFVVLTIFSFTTLLICYIYNIILVFKIFNALSDNYIFTKRINRKSLNVPNEVDNKNIKFQFSDVKKIKYGLSKLSFFEKKQTLKNSDINSMTLHQVNHYSKTLFRIMKKKMNSANSSGKKDKIKKNGKK